MLSQTHYKKQRIQINKIRNVKGEVTTNITERQRIIRDYYKKLHANKIDNLKDNKKNLRKVQSS